MAEAGNGVEKGCSSTEPYEDVGEMQGGACAADHLAGPGKDVWGPKVNRGRPARKGKSRGEKILEKRVEQLERELLEGRVRSKKKSRSKVVDSSDVSDTSSSSGESTSSSDSSVSSHHHHRHRSPSPDGRRRRSTSREGSRRGKYDRKRQMDKGDVVESAEGLLVYLIRLLRRCYKRGKRVRGLIDHILVMAEKAETGYYKLASLVGYDDECREIASEKGLSSFGDIKPSTVLKLNFLN